MTEEKHYASTQNNVTQYKFLLSDMWAAGREWSQDAKVSCVVDSVAMRVPARLTTATENSAQTQDDNNVIEKIKNDKEADKSPLYQIYQVLHLEDHLQDGRTNRNNLRNNATMPAFIYPIVRLVPNADFDKDHESTDGLQQLLKNSYFHEDTPWQLPTAVTKQNSSAYGVEYSEVSSAWSNSWLWMVAPLFNFFLVLLLGILISKLIRCCKAPQPNICHLIERLEEQERSNRLDSPVSSHDQNEDNLSVTLSVESQYSDQSDNDTDLPPPYSECGTNRPGTNNLAFSSHELPPSYSTCLGTLNNLDEILKVHKGSVAVPRAPPDADPNNIVDADRSNEHRSRTLSTVVDTTADLDNRMVSIQSRPDVGNRNFQ